MSTNPYHVLGETPASMFGRKRIFEQVLAQLTKPDPEHLSVVGPKWSGKSVLLRALAENLHGGESYVCVVSWDFRSNLPQTDEDFLRQLAGQLSGALRGVGDEAADLLDVDGDDVLGDLGLAIDEIWQSGHRALVLMDGFDAVLAADHLTRTLWDNLLDLARRPGLRLVTASRGRLRELLKHNARPSIFWENFSPNPVVLGAFAAEEFSALTEPFAGRDITFEPSAEKEVFNESGGHPVLCAALLSALFDGTADGASVNGDAVKECAVAAAEGLQEVYAEIWDDCCAIEAGLIVGKLAQGELSLPEVPDAMLTQLVLRGVASASRDSVRFGARMLEPFVRRQAPRARNLADLFMRPGDYEGNIVSVLQLRLGQVEDLDADLKADIVRAVRELGDEPRHCVNCMRGIAERCLALIWSAELEAGDLIPQAWLDEFQHDNSSLARRVVADAATRGRRLPTRSGRQCGLLNLATGSQNTPRVTRYVSRKTYLLVDQIQNVGDFGQHQTEAVDIGFAVSLCLSAIELAHKLTAELP